MKRGIHFARIGIVCITPFIAAISTTASADALCAADPRANQCLRVAGSALTVLAQAQKEWKGAPQDAVPCNECPVYDNNCRRTLGPNSPECDAANAHCLSTCTGSPAPNR
jgi:hypothetical protein